MPFLEDKEKTGRLVAEQAPWSKVATKGCGYMTQQL